MVSSTQSSTSVWGNYRVRQAQTQADRAEANWRALKPRAADAENEASRAERRAESLSSSADQARVAAGAARQNAVSARSAAGEKTSSLATSLYNLSTSSGLTTQTTGASSVGKVIDTTA